MTGGLEDCIQGMKLRGRIPINWIMLGCAIHYFICVFIFSNLSKNTNLPTNGGGNGANNSKTELNKKDNNDDINGVNTQTNNDNNNNEDDEEYNPYAPENDNDNNNNKNEQIKKANTTDVASNAIDLNKEKTFIIVVKLIICVIFAIMGCVQMVFDYRQWATLFTDKSILHFDRFECASYIFTNSPNVVHFVASLFAFLTALIIRKFEKANRKINISLILAELIFLICSPYLASFLIHLIPGVLTYIWITAPFAALAVFSFVKAKEKGRVFDKRLFFLLVLVFGSMLVISSLVVIIGNTQIKLYNGTSYWESFRQTLTERSTKKFFAADMDFETIYTFVWLLL